MSNENIYANIFVIYTAFSLSRQDFLERQLLSYAAVRANFLASYIAMLPV